MSVLREEQSYCEADGRYVFAVAKDDVEKLWLLKRKQLWQRMRTETTHRVSGFCGWERTYHMSDIPVTSRSTITD